MKTLCAKPGKGGKIHPSPVEDPIRAAFRLLPAAILVLVAELRAEDREVLAYFVTCPVEGGLATERGGGGRGSSRRRVGYTPAFWVVSHPPTHGCGCVDCYISFWARWQLSPERDRILDAVSAFEEHLAASGTPPTSSKRRDRGRRNKLPATPPPRRAKTPEPKVVEVAPEPGSPLPLSCLPPPPTPAPTSCTAEKVEENVVPEPAAEAEVKKECCEVAADEERKRGWADVVMGGVLGRRLRGMLLSAT